MDRVIQRLQGGLKALGFKAFVKVWFLGGLNALFVFVLLPMVLTRSQV